MFVTMKENESPAPSSESITVLQEIKNNKSSTKPRPNRKICCDTGAWTKQFKHFPTTFTQDSIINYQCKSKAKKHTSLGYRMFKADKVKKVFILKKNSDTCGIFVKAKVQGSFKLNKMYDVGLHLAENGDVVRGECCCPAGLGGVCKHACALLWYLFDCVQNNQTFIPADLSCTDVLKKWGVHKSKVKKTKKISDLNFVKHDPFKSNRKRNAKEKMPFCSLPNDQSQLTFIRIKNLYSKFVENGCRAMWCDIIQANNFESVQVIEEKLSYVSKANFELELAEDRISLPISSLQCLLEFDHEYCDMNSLTITLSEAHDLEEATRKQSGCDLWKSMRCKLLTASKFGEVYKRKKDISVDYVKKLLCGADLKANKYVQEGILNEDSAASKYATITGNSICNVGLCINPSLPFLGASPDRLVFDPCTREFGLLEIKTFARAKELGLTIIEAIKDKRINTCVTEDENGEIKLKTNHNFYYQVQGQLGITDLKWCDFLVDTGCEMSFVRIPFDSNFFHNMLPKLSDFYFNHIVPYLNS